MENSSKLLLRLSYYMKTRHVHSGCSKYIHSRLSHLSELAEKDSDLELKNKINSFKGKILYNSIIHGEKVNYMLDLVKNRKQLEDIKCIKKAKQLQNPIPICLSYLDNSKSVDKKEACVEIEKSPFYLPFGDNTSLEDASVVPKDDETEILSKLEDYESNLSNWMVNYEHFDDSLLKEDLKQHNKLDIEPSLPSDSLNTRLKVNYGTPDPSIAVSRVKCSGCGALLHCRDTAIPGYIPSEIFKGRKVNELKSIICQRCHFLKEYNIALDLNTTPEEYVKILEKIKNERALVILMIDLLDFPCSIWPGIKEIIGVKRPVFIVGNKVDLLPQDSKYYLNNIKQCLKDSVIESEINETNIKHVSLISAKTGYGIEELINSLHMLWGKRDDIYLLGCTNVGKSTLFNALLQSDFCRVDASDLLQRATISKWPGTTLHLLKFPILKATGWKLFLRNQRLREEAKLGRAEKELRMKQLKATKNTKYATLIGKIGRTFANGEDLEEIGNISDPYSYNMSPSCKKVGPVGVNERDIRFVNSKWCYDTPGVLHPDQMLSILTIDELMSTMPQRLLRPRSFFIEEGTSLFIGGLSRLDCVKCNYPVRFTVFASEKLPISTCKIEDADEFYSTFLGTELLSVPEGNVERLKRWPMLERNENEFTVTGQGWKMSVADIVLSSSGWVSVTGADTQQYKLLGWTPNAKGIHLRTPLLPYAIRLKGKRIKGTTAYHVGRLFESYYVKNKRR